MTYKRDFWLCYKARALKPVEHMKVADEQFQRRLRNGGFDASNIIGEQTHKYLSCALVEIKDVWS